MLVLIPFSSLFFGSCMAEMLVSCFDDRVQHLLNLYLFISSWFFIFLVFLLDLENFLVFCKV